MDALRSFEEFWPYYVGAHRNPVCRGLHYLGTSLSLCAVARGVLSGNPSWFLAAPVLGYGFAWIGHFFIERNRPATFDYFLWSLRGDLRMLRLALSGRMADEVIRLYGSRNPPADAPLRRSAKP
ncbi:MAG: DUF962 domain-containing protein [Nannocystaceae bacterium]|nr:DUF962 domain-containing protein [Myxococcales bacterium]